MTHRGEERTKGIRCSSNPSIGINFQGAKISSDTGILLLREIDEHFGIASALEETFQHSRYVSNTQHSCTDLLRQRVYQIAAGYEDCNDANELRKDPALRLALGKNNAYAASQSARPPLSGGEGYLLDDGFCDFAFGYAQNDREGGIQRRVKVFRSE